MLPRVQIAECFKPLFKPKRYKVFYGGRGAAKSWGFAQALELMGAQNKLRILCTRELQGSIQESVHKLLSDTANRIGLDDFYGIEKALIYGKNNTHFIFEGLKNNTTKIKSMEGIDVCWCEEAEAITENSWDLLIPTIRKDGSEIWISFNPADEMDATYQRFVKPYQTEIENNGFYEDGQIYVCKVSWRDNPWFPDELKKEMERCREENYKKYLHIWEGECNANYEDSIIQPEWFKAAIDAHLKRGFKPMGVRSLGFDPADGGQDSKAIAHRHGVVITRIEQWETGDLEDATDKAFRIADEIRSDFIVYDNIGIGAGIKIGLSKRLEGKRLKAHGYCGAESPENPTGLYSEDRSNSDVFRNLRAQYWWYLRDRFEKTYRAIEKNEYIDPNELISISSDIPRETLSALQSELTRVQRKRGSGANTFIQIESKEDMRRRNMKSPNMADALVMCFANPSPEDDEPQRYSRDKKSVRRSAWAM